MSTGHSAEPAIEELPHAQWICGGDASEGHLCRCVGSRTECGCSRHTRDALTGQIVCGVCGEAMIAIDFASGEPASPEQTRALMAEILS